MNAEAPAVNSGQGIALWPRVDIFVGSQRGIKPPHTLEYFSPHGSAAYSECGRVAVRPDGYRNEEAGSGTAKPSPCGSFDGAWSGLGIGVVEENEDVSLRVSNAGVTGRRLAATAG